MPDNDLMHRLHEERIVFAEVSPRIDCGRYPIKRIAGDWVRVRATLLREGHDRLAGELMFLHESEKNWHRVPLKVEHGHLAWAEFQVERLGLYQYTLEAWTDAFGTWRHHLRQKHEAGLSHLKSELLEGASLIRAAGRRASGADQNFLLEAAQAMETLPQAEAIALGLDLQLEAAVARWAQRLHLSALGQLLSVLVERERARFGAWYELFPRSCTSDPARHGTFRGVIDRLPEIARMGFDVIYLPPIHPIGTTHRKGRNNHLQAGPSDVGSPWAIGSAAGGHDAVHPQLGTLGDFQALVRAAGSLGLEIALDLALQCSPDHPYVREHPDWFRVRPDGTIAHAENPPKKYQDIFPINFDTADWPSLWREWERIVRFWIDQGVKIFRVDNPHTKPLGFWEWLLGQIRSTHPEVVFLSEAFTAEPMMKALAKVGFSQSYTYFTWINDAAGLRDYLHRLTNTEMAEYFRPNFFANTPDILHAYLQQGGRPAFKIRAVLASMLSPSWGIYSGYELCEHVPAKPGSEEYLDSEKYQIRIRDWDVPQSLADYLHRLNRTRQRQPALRTQANLVFHHCDVSDILCFSKRTPDNQSRVIVVVNVNPREARGGDVWLNLNELGLGENQAFDVEDQLTGAVWHWRGSRNYVRLEPVQEPAHVLVVRQ